MGQELYGRWEKRGQEVRLSKWKELEEKGKILKQHQKEEALRK